MHGLRPFHGKLQCFARFSCNVHEMFMPSKFFSAYITFETESRFAPLDRHASRRVRFFYP